MAEQKVGGRFNNFQQFLQHALDCSDSSCVLPLCVNTKLTLKHSQTCRKKTKCAICQEMKSLVSKHSEYCVDYYCRIAFCMEAKLEVIKQAATQIDLSDCLDVILQETNSWAPQIESMGDVESYSNSGSLPIPRSPPFRSKASPSKSALMQMSPPLLELGMNRLPPMAVKESGNHSSPFNNPSSLSQSSQVSLEQRTRCQSTVTVATGMANSQWEGVMGPYHASNQSTLTTSTKTTAAPSFVKGRENAATPIQQDLIDLSSSLPSAQEQAPRQQSNQNSNKRRRKSTDQMNAACLSSRRAEETFGAASRAVCLDLNSIMGRENEATNSQSILLKVRITNSLFSLMRLIMNTKTREELLICVSSLRSALHEIKTQDVVEEN